MILVECRSRLTCHCRISLQQWVWEVCFPTGKSDTSNGNDMVFMETLLRRIEESGIPAHSPIEQRWTASSSSLMSPAHSRSGDVLFSWVGIIMYLPSDNEGQRRDITDRFRGQYCNLLKDVGLPVNAASHWAKLERPRSAWEAIDMHLLINSRFPLARFNDARSLWDPHNILTSPDLALVLGKPMQDESLLSKWKHRKDL